MSTATENSTALEKMRTFIQSFSDADILSHLSIDYTDSIPNCGGLFPSGLVKVSSKSDILGNITVTNQCNFALYTVFAKSPQEDVGATYNADWLMSFQEWVQEQSEVGLAPAFGDDPKAESIVAQNGAIYSADEEGIAVYAIQISVTYTKKYRKGINHA